MTNLTATKGKTVFTLTKSEDDRPNLKAHLISNGFDGDVYFGVNAKGTKHAMFYKSAKNGEFVHAVTI